MSGLADKRKRGGLWLACVLAVLLLCTLYAVSSDPVHAGWWIKPGDIPRNPSFRDAYVPLFWITKQMGLDDEFDKWLDWWTPVSMP